MKKKRVLFISSTGGHFNELQQLQPLFEKYDYHIITEKDKSTEKLTEKYGDKIMYLPYGTRQKLFRYIFIYTFLCFKTIYLYLDEKKVEYKIIAIKIVTTDIEHMKVSFSSDSDFKEHTDKLLSDSLYRDQSEKVTKNDKLLVLQICHYDPMGSYLLVIAKAVND